MTTYTYVSKDAGVANSEEILKEDNWSEYKRLYNKIGFIDVPESNDECNEQYIKINGIIKKETDDTPSRVRDRQQLIGILIRNGAYDDIQEWFDQNCPDKTVEDNNNNNNEDNIGLVSNQPASRPGIEGNDCCIPCCIVL